ncbi:carboxypeptidase-like regulatory domain-containing protein [Priestia megaterium]
MGVVIATTQTDINGNYLVPNLSPGSYQVVALNVNFQAQTKNVTLVPNQTEIVNFALLENPSTLSGTVIDNKTGFPLIGALIEVLNISGIPIAYGLTNQDGQYIIEGLPQGLLLVRVSASGYISQTRQVEIGPGKVNENFSLTRPLPILGTIAGRVFDALTQAPIINARLDIVNGQGQLVTFVFTNQNGQYVVEGLLSDTYMVFASATNYLEQQQTIVLRESEFAPVNFQLSRVTQFGTIVGEVINSETQQLIQGALVEVLNAQGDIVTTERTDAFGSFTIEGLIPDSYTLRIAAEGFAQRTQQATVVVGDITSVSIVLTPISNIGTIIGKVINAKTHQPIQGALVEVLNAQGDVVTAERTDTFGNFTIEGLPIETLIVRASSQNFLPQSQIVTLTTDETEIVNFRLVRKEELPIEIVLNPQQENFIYKILSQLKAASTKRTLIWIKDSYNVRVGPINTQNIETSNNDTDLIANNIEVLSQVLLILLMQLDII